MLLLFYGLWQRIRREFDTTAETEKVDANVLNILSFLEVAKDHWDGDFFLGRCCAGLLCGCKIEGLVFGDTLT